MKQLITTTAICLFATGQFAGPASAITAQELCDRVFEQYGLRSDECILEDEKPASAGPAAPSQEMLQNHVFFEAGGSALDARAITQLSVLANVLNTSMMQNACLRLVGHSDSSGSAERNQQIALERANAVAAQLRKGLDDANRVREVDSEGESRALEGFDPTSRYNRRVEIFAKTCN
jgi:outer membrane protein OmpA-like peptidoglycan-associated protein